MTWIANTRMYEVNPTVAAAWAALVAEVANRAGVPLAPHVHAPPAPLETLWARPDLGLTMICGWPFSKMAPQGTPLAAPVPAGDAYENKPLYWTDMIVAADSPIRTLEGSFGKRLGWTVEASHSGYNAPRRLLLDHITAPGQTLYAETVGPLVTPRAALEAVIEGRADIAPLDSYFHALLKLTEPETAARIRVVARTPKAPIPLLIGAADMPEETAKALRAALVTLKDDPAGRDLLAALSLSRFTEVEADAYKVAEDWASLARDRGYPAPA